VSAVSRRLGTNRADPPARQSIRLTAREAAFRHGRIQRSIRQGSNRLAAQLKFQRIEVVEARAVLVDSEAASRPAQSETLKVSVLRNTRRVRSHELMAPTAVCWRRQYLYGAPRDPVSGVAGSWKGWPSV